MPKRFALLHLALLAASPLAGQSNGTFAKRPDVLPSGFQPETFPALVGRLTIAPKGEVESTAEFRQRVAATTDELWHTIEIDSTCGQMATRYDADAKKMHVEIRVDPIGEQPLDGKLFGAGHSALCVHRSGQVRSTYEGSNAFNAKVQVAQVSDSMDGIRLNVPPGMFRGVRDFAVARDEAIALKNDLKFVVMFQLDPDKTIGHVDRPHETIRPTRDAPLDRRTDYRLILATKVQVAVVNRSTGKVYLWLERY